MAIVMICKITLTQLKKSGPSSETENGPKTKKAYPKTSLDGLI